MGRLIEKEKLIAEMKKAEAEPAYQHTGEDWYVGMVSAEGLVDEAETVDAIPVEWIKEKIQTLRNENSYTSYHLSECFKALLIDWRRGKKREQTD